MCEKVDSEVIRNKIYRINWWTNECNIKKYIDIVVLKVDKLTCSFCPNK